MTENHSTRKHSKFSASGAERWFNCPGSVALSEGMPDKPSSWAEEGTKAHEVLEKILTGVHVNRREAPREMIIHGTQAAGFMRHLRNQHPGSELLVETRVVLDFIHPEMFGTYDGAVVDHYGTLHVFDYKYGAGHSVSPKENLQMIFYGIGLAHKYQWNFQNVRLWIIQPRVRGYDGPVYWELNIPALKEWSYIFQTKVNHVERYPRELKEGSWCHWCKAKSVCPLKNEKKLDEAKTIFSNRKENLNGNKEKEALTFKNEEEISKKETRKKTKS